MKTHCFSNGLMWTWNRNFNALSQIFNNKY